MGINAKFGIATTKPISYTYADEAARIAATGFVTADLGKFAWQTDNDTIWMLKAIDPTWIPIKDEDIDWLIGDYDPSGFDRGADGKGSSSIGYISFDDGTRTFTIEPQVGESDFWFYSSGNKFTKTSAENVVITDVEGNHFIYYDESGVLSHISTFVSDLVTRFAWVSTIYWDADNGESIYFADERHGYRMSGKTHLHLHRGLGCRYYSGLDIGDLIVDGNGDLDTHVQFSYGGGSIGDEDIVLDISAVSEPANIPIYYRFGSLGNWRLKDLDAFPVIYTGTAGYAGTRVPYNQWTGSTWQLTELANANFVVMLYFATNDPSRPVIGIQGQNSYSTVSSAREGILTEIGNLITDGLPFLEFIGCWGLIVQSSSGMSNVPHATFRSLDNGDSYLNLRNIAGVSTGNSQITAHSQLSGLTAPADDHTQYIPVDGTRPSSVWGDIMFRGESGWEALTAGTSGQVLQTNGASANPSWYELPSGLQIPLTVSSNSVGYGAILWPNSSGELVEAGGSSDPVAPGLYMALGTGTGTVTVLCWSGGIVTNGSWSLTPNKALYLSTDTPGTLSTDVNGDPVAISLTSTSLYFGPIHSSYQGVEIVLTHTGQTIEFIIDVDTVTYPDAEILWTFADATTSNSVNPTKDFGTPGERQTTLSVNPWSALTLFDAGYTDNEDGSVLGPQYNLAQQNITAITGLQAASSLEAICLSRNPLTDLNLSGLTSLNTIECYEASSIANCNVSGCTALTRICVEKCDLTTLDVSDALALEDVRSSDQTTGLETIVMPPVGNRGNIWHFCSWGNNYTTNPDFAGMTGLTQLLMNTTGLTGTLTVEGGSLVYAWLYYNAGLTGLDVSGAYDTGGAGWLAAEHCNLSTIDISNNPTLGRLELNDNNFDAAGVDSVLAQLVANGNQTYGNLTVNLTNNVPPSGAGLSNKSILEGWGWTVSVDASLAPYITDYLPLDNATGVAIDTSFLMTFNEVVTALTGNIELYNSIGTLIEQFDVTTDITGSGTDTIGFTPTSPLSNATGYYILIDANTFENAGSIPFDGITDSTTWNITTISAAPEISILSPLDDASSVAVDTSFQITFNEAVYAQAGGTIDIRTTVGDTLFEQFDVTTDITGSGTAVIGFTPSVSLDGLTGYYVQISVGAFEDVESNAFAGIIDTTTWNFTTASTAPEILTLSPQDDGTNIAIDTSFQIVFNEAVTAQAGGTINLYKSDTTLIESFDVTTDITGDGTDTIGFTPASNLDNSTGYYVQISSGAFENSGGQPFAGISDDTTWNFTTISASSALWSDDFNRSDGAPGNGWVTYGSATHAIVSNEYVRTETSGYQVSGNYCGGILPANYRFTIQIPHARTTDTYWGISTRVVDNAGTLTGARVMFLTTGLLVAGNVANYIPNDYTITVTGGYPASWTVNQNHTMGIESVGTTHTIYFDDSEYGYFIADINNTTGTGIAIAGEGRNRPWDNVVITSV